nr:hypothetical protein [Tanacetum cinerariifolium]
EIKKGNDKVYAAQVGYEQCKGPHYTKDCPLKEEGNILEEAYYTQFSGPFQRGGYKAATSDQEVKELKLYMRIIPEEDIAIEAIPLAINPSVIIEYKIVKEGKISTYHITRADGSTRRYTLMISLLENIDREDLKTLWKLVKDKYGNTRLEEGYE